VVFAATAGAVVAVAEVESIENAVANAAEFPSTAVADFVGTTGGFAASAYCGTEIREGYPDLPGGGH